MIYIYIILYYIILYYIILYHIILYCILLYFIILYFIIFYIICYYVILSFTLLYHIIFYYVILYYIILYYIISYCITSYHFIYYTLFYFIILHYIILYDFIILYTLYYIPTVIQKLLNCCVYFMIHHIYIYNIIDRYVRLLIDASVQYYLLHGEGYYDWQRCTWRSGGRVPKSIGWRYASKALAANLNLHFVCKKMFCVSIEIRYSWIQWLKAKCSPSFMAIDCGSLRLSKTQTIPCRRLSTVSFCRALSGAVSGRMSVIFTDGDISPTKIGFDKSLYSVYTLYIYAVFICNLWKVVL